MASIKQSGERLRNILTPTTPPVKEMHIQPRALKLLWKSWVKFVFVASLNTLWSIVTPSAMKHDFSTHSTVYEIGTKFIDFTSKRVMMWSRKFGTPQESRVEYR